MLAKPQGLASSPNSSGLILIFEEPRLVTGVSVVVGTTVTGGDRHADIHFRYN